MPRKNPEDDKAYRKKYEQTAKYKKWRSEWGKKWRAKNPGRAEATAKRYIENNRDKVRERHNKFAREYTQRLRRELIEQFGGRCLCCGEGNYAFLTIDHINGDGKQHRRAFGGSTRELYRDLARKGGTKKYAIQILCFNCNCARQFAGGKDKICPHKLTQEGSL